jgi:hypothetical protein
MAPLNKTAGKRLKTVKNTNRKLGFSYASETSANTGIPSIRVIFLCK